MKINYVVFEDQVTDCICDLLEVSRSDAQGILEANEDETRQAWKSGISAYDFVIKNWGIETTHEKVIKQLNRLSLRDFATMKHHNGKVSIEHEEALEVMEYRYSDVDDFAAGIELVLDLLKNGWIYKK